MTTPTLAMESSLAIVAGSDTTSTALSNALFHLLTTPAALAALRAELDAAAGNAAYDVPWEAAQLADLPYLNAIM
jgi:cytochrome P450